MVLKKNNVYYKLGGEGRKRDQNIKEGREREREEEDKEEE